MSSSIISHHRRSVQKTRKPILITGSHRSGTTWVGNILASAHHTGYIHEPFNIAIKISPSQRLFSNWYQYISTDNAVEYRYMLDCVLKYNYPLWSNIYRARSPRNIAKIAREKFRSVVYKTHNCTPIMKDPLAFFSAEWLSQTFDMNVLVMIRHPAAFCSSLMIVDRGFNFENFLRQPSLMEKYLGPYREEIQFHAKKRHDTLDQAILLWNCIYHTASVYVDEHPDWLFVRHEDLSLNPVDRFREVFEALGLEFSERSIQKILNSSGARNRNIIEHRRADNIKRHSAENITIWKKRLNASQIARVRSGTWDVARRFYGDKDW